MIVIYPNNTKMHEVQIFSSNLTNNCYADKNCDFYNTFMERIVAACWTFDYTY